MALMANHSATHQTIPNIKCYRVLTVLVSSAGHSTLYQAVAAEISTVIWLFLPAEFLFFVSPIARAATLIQCHAVAHPRCGWLTYKRA